MKKLLLPLLLLTVAGCSEWAEMEAKAEQERLAAIERANQKRAMLTNGKIYIGMTDDKFARLWGKPPDRWIEHSTSRYGVTEWWWFNWDCEPSTLRFSSYGFCFVNGILDYWSEN